jgi:hypothetical protein
MEDRIKTYAEFYQYYLKEHQNTANRVLISSKSYWMWILIPVIGYGFAWFGHFFFEKNKPATFKYPFWSLISDFKLFFEILMGKRRFNAKWDPRIRVRKN